MPIKERLLEYFYPGIVKLGCSPIDGTLAFYSHINQILPDRAVILDFGAGRGGAETTDSWRTGVLKFAPKIAARIGCDVDAAVLGNPLLDEAYLLKAEEEFRIPIANESCDCVMMDWVVEHLPAPVFSFADAFRVLKPGGWLCIRTPNRWHYAYLIAAAVAGSPLESKLLRRSQGDREEKDVFPKLYRANTRGSLMRALEKSGYESSCIVPWEPEAAYLNFHPLGVIAGGVYGRIAATGLLPKATLMAFARKA